MAERRAPAALFAAVVLLYLSVPSAMYNFDGVACAIAVELGDLEHLVHGNHLAYGLVAFLWCKLWWALGCQWRAVYLMQVLSSILGAASVAVFLRILLRQKIDPWLSAAASLGLAVSALYWIWSVEAQVYPLGTFFLMLAFAELTRDTPKPAAAGAWHAAGVLGHVGHVMFAPAAYRFLLTSRKPDVARVARYGAALAGIVAAAYAATLVCIVRPASFGEFRYWMLGSAALGVDKKFAWVGGYSGEGFLEWGMNALRLFGAGPIVGGGLWLLAGFGAVAGLRRHRRFAAGCLFWLAGYAVLYTCWHPGQPVYRYSDLAPLWGLIALAVEEAQALRRVRKAPTLALAGVVLALGYWNLTRVVIPNGMPGRNEELQRALWISKVTPHEAWVIVDDIDQVYVPYFGHRHPLNLRYFQGRPGALRERIKESTRRGQPVYVVVSELQPLSQDLLDGVSMRQVARRGAEVVEQLLAE